MRARTKRVFSLSLMRRKAGIKAPRSAEKYRYYNNTAAVLREDEVRSGRTRERDPQDVCAVRIKRTIAASVEEETYACVCVCACMCGVCGRSFDSYLREGRTTTVRATQSLSLSKRRCKTT